MNLKVISVYLGPRRSFPKTTEEAYQLLDYVVENERRVDPGCPVDTVLVHNRDHGDKSLSYLHNQPTKAGKFILLERENTGLSFGAYNAAFQNFQADYWAFTEDDQLIIKNNYYQVGKTVLDDPSVGYVAFTGAFDVPGSAHPPHCHGGHGMTRRGVLEAVVAKHGRLLYYDGTEDISNLDYNLWDSYGGERYKYQEVLGEIRFTNSIYRLGYKLVNHPNTVWAKWPDVPK